jgi:hypothetical protein
MRIITLTDKLVDSFENSTGGKVGVIDWTEESEWEVDEEEEKEVEKVEDVEEEKEEETSWYFLSEEEVEIGKTLVEEFRSPFE